METIETIIRQNGTLTERTIRERDLDAEQSVLEALTDEVTVSYTHLDVYKRQGGRCGAGCCGW